MHEYYCEYWTQQGHKCGERIFARDSIEAKKIIECRPEFKRHHNYPKKLN